MREAVYCVKAENAALALLEDRVATQQGKGQIYGGQMKKDPETDTYHLPPSLIPIKLTIGEPKWDLTHRGISKKLEPNMECGTTQGPNRRIERKLIFYYSEKSKLTTNQTVSHLRLDEHY